MKSERSSCTILYTILGEKYFQIQEKINISIIYLRYMLLKNFSKYRIIKYKFNSLKYYGFFRYLKITDHFIEFGSAKLINVFRS